MKIEHEVDQRPLEARSRATQHGEARAREPRGALEIENPERRPKIPVRLRREIKRAGRPAPSYFDVVLRALSNRHAGMRQVREIEQRRIALMFRRIELDAELFDLRRARPVRFLNVRGVEPLTLRTRDFVARRVLLALQ